MWIITSSKLYLKVAIKQDVKINHLSSFYLSYPDIYVRSINVTDTTFSFEISITFKNYLVSGKR